MHARRLLAALYFADIGAVGAWLPFLALHLDRRGVEGGIIGLLLATIPAARMLSAPLWSLLADRTRSGRALLRLATAGGLLCASAIVFFDLGPLGLGLALLLFSSFRSPISPLLDSSAVSLLSRAGLDPSGYGRIRVWGTVGFLVGSAIGATLTTVEGAGEAAMGLALAGWTVSAALAWSLPPAPPAAPAPILPALRRLGRSPFLLPMIASLCLHGVGLSFYDTLLPMHFAALGLPGWTLALALGTGLLAEITVLWYGDRLIRRLGPLRMLSLAGLAGVLRWGLMAVLTQPHALVLLQASHGLVFAWFWVGGVEAMRRHAPEEVRVSAQSLLTVAAYGLGSLLASSLASALLETQGTRGLFALAAGLSTLATLGLLIAERRQRRAALADGCSDRAATG